MKSGVYNDVIVKKPWGHEYLCFANKTVAIWLLKIDHNAKTSMHCHPNKHTGLIVLNGSIELSFLTNKILLESLKKITIFQSRFHSSKAISKDGAYLLEIETPEDKNDLIRLYDEYGRENQDYEGKESFLEKPRSALKIKEPSFDPIITKAYGCQIQHRLFKNSMEIGDFREDDLIVFTNGGLEAKKNKKILRPADVIDGRSLTLLSTRFILESNPSALIISQET